MQKIFLLSDTHGFWDDAWIKYIEQADEVWHAGDIGNTFVIDKINNYAKEKMKNRMVYGNIDGQDIRIQTKEYQVFQIEKLTVLITHIAGGFSKYNSQTKRLIQLHHPNILVCGHSHILKIKYDESNKLWYINPGAAGTYGLHYVRTALFFEVNNEKIQNFKIVEWSKK